MICSTCKKRPAVHFFRKGAANRYACYAGKRWSVGQCDECRKAELARVEQLAREAQERRDRARRVFDLYKAAKAEGRDADAEALFREFADLT